MAANLFGTTDYKKYLRAVVEENRGEYGYKSKLAEAAGCQKSFFSQVLNGHVHLTPEHAIGLARFWRLNNLERDYLLELVNYGRAGTKALADHLKENLAELRREHENLGKRYAQPVLGVTDDLASVYYSSWHYSAIHILLTIPEYRSAAGIARRLHLPDAFVMEVLRHLESLGLAERRADGSWGATQKSIHLPNDSVFSAVNNHNWRIRAHESGLRRDPQAIHYTGIYSLSRDDVEKLRELLFRVIDRSREIVTPSKEEELICFACDLFRV
jgi:uncharacterized protein (TIGR02147 family)